MDYILTLIIPVILVFCVLYGNRKLSSQDAFMNKDFTTVLKGACCIIVILVHIPLTYSNKIQDSIGSFAYVGVTLFFLVSAYGMNVSANHNSDYLHNFWRNRLSSLLIPQLVLNVFVFALSLTNVDIEGKSSLLTLVTMNSYVIVLLQYCLWFYLVSLGKHFYGSHVLNLLLIGGVVVSSLLMYFCFGAKGWCYERWGLIWGILLFLFMPQVKRLIKLKVWKVLLWGFLSLILGIMYLKFKSVFFYGEYLLKIVLGLIIIIFLFVLSSQRKFGNRIINFLGDISYEVYLSHGFIIYLLKNFTPDLSSGIFILLTVSLTIVFSTLIYYIDRPIVKLCRKK